MRRTQYPDTAFSIVVPFVLVLLIAYQVYAPSYVLRLTLIKIFFIDSID